ncbi:hypothetical protein HC928_15505 [bacterium]|nr:hypothetical protein [bacterium]
MGWGKKRQDERRQKIKSLSASLQDISLSEKELKTITKQLQDAEVMQTKEDKKYQDNFNKFFGKLIEGQKKVYAELTDIESGIKRCDI